MRARNFVVSGLSLATLVASVAMAQDIQYLPSADGSTGDFNHAATQIFLHGQDLLNGIGIASAEVSKASPGPLKNGAKQLLATFYTFAGRYDEANLLYLHAAHPTAVTKALESGGVPHFKRASDAIADMAKERKAVFINENHGEPITRTLMLELLPKLRAAGYTYLALETLNRSEVEGRSSEAKQCIFLKDDGLCARGYALDDVKTGVYSHEPIYGELLKLAVSLGYHLVAYDDDKAADDVARDKGQATNLANVFRTDPSARLVAFGGFDHIAKEDTNMAAEFRAMSAIDPLSVDQVDLLGVSPVLWGKYQSEAQRYDASVVFFNGHPLSTRPNAMDVTVYRPTYKLARADAHWLTLDGHRVPVMMDHRCQTFPCLLTARRKGESDGVPADRLYLDSPDDQVMYLEPGEYQLTVETVNGQSDTAITIASGKQWP